MKRRDKNVFDRRRRELLKVFAAAGVGQGLLRASPLVAGTLVSRWAEAQTGPNKSVVIYVPDGAIPNLWYPSADLSSFPVMSAPYAAVRQQCHFLRNMGHHRGGHGVVPTIINNSWGGDSFDVNMGRILSEGLPFSYVNLGVHSNGHGTLTKDNGVEVPFEDNPFNAFNRLFGNGGGGGASDPRGNVIDVHKAALDALRPRLGVFERQRLDAHLAAIEQVQQRLQSLAGGAGACATGPAPTPFELTYDTFEQQAKLQADIIVLALQCNLTASCSLGLGNHQGEFSFPYLNFTGIYHQSIHGGNNGDPSYPHFSETRAHLSSLSAYLIQRLTETGLIDSTVVCEVTDMGDGDAHSSNDVPLIMAGGGSAVRRGVSNAGGASYTPLHLIHTAAVALNAHQHPLYQGYASDVIPGLLA